MEIAELVKKIYAMKKEEVVLLLNTWSSNVYVVIYLLLFFSLDNCLILGLKDHRLDV